VGHDQTLRLWDVSRGTPRAPGKALEGAGGLVAVAFSPDGKLLAAAGSTGVIYLLELSEGRITKTKGPPKEIADLAFHPQFTEFPILASAGADGKVRLWDVTEEGLNESTVIAIPGGGLVYRVAFTPNGKLLATAGRDSNVRLWADLTEMEPRMVGETRAANEVFGLAFDREGRRLAAGVAHSCQWWDFDGKELKQRALVVGFHAMTRRVVFHPNKPWVYAVGYDYTVRCWDLSGDKPREVFPITQGHSFNVTSVAFAPDGKTVATSSTDWTVRLWDLAQGKPRERERLNMDRAVFHLALAPDGKTLAAACGTLATASGLDVRLWDLTPPRPAPRAILQQAGAVTVAFSPDGKTLAAGCTDRTICLWDLTQVVLGKPNAVFTRDLAAVAAVAFTPDGKRLASASHDGLVRLWDPHGGAAQKGVDLPGGSDRPLLALAIDADGRRLAAGGVRGGVLLWERGSKDPPSLLTTATPPQPVRGVAFAPDGQTLASCHDDGRVVLWDVATRKEKRSWQLPGKVSGVAFAPDGRHLATANANGTAYILRLAAPPR
jgi:WD40 repeat protein